MTILSICLSFACLPFIIIYFHSNASSFIGSEESSESYSCPVPYTYTARLPFSHSIDIIFCLTLYSTALMITVYSFLLLCIWLPVAGLALVISLISSKEKTLIEVYQHINDSSIVHGFSDNIEFLIWPIGLPKYILCSIFER
jgi:hypothetical protein